MDIAQLRATIDEIDEQILILLSKRAEIAELIGQYKIDNHISVQDRERENEILKRLLKTNKGPLSDKDVDAIFKNIIKACRILQNKPE